MATVKRVSGDYTINSQLVTINGNLVVTGNTTTINTTETVVQDNVITLNGNLAASSAPVLNAGIEVNRGNQSKTSLRWKIAHVAVLLVSTLFQPNRSTAPAKARSFWSGFFLFVDHCLHSPYN